MTEKVSRKTRQSAPVVADQPGQQPLPTDTETQDRELTSSLLDMPADQDKPTEGACTSPPQEEALSKPVDDHSSFSNAGQAPKRIKTIHKKILHKNWERVCHAVPKCDSCGKKSGQVGILQRCVQCTTQLCRTCVEEGALEPEKNSAHPIVHVMDLEDIDWSPATKEEKAAQAKQKKIKKAAEPVVASSSKVKGKGKMTAVKGVGLRKQPVRALTDESNTEEVPLPKMAVPTTPQPGGVSSGRQPSSFMPPITPAGARKRVLSPTDEEAETQSQEKYPKLTAPAITPINSLAPLRSVMEPRLSTPATRLPSINDLGSHGLQYGRQEPYAVPQPVQQGYSNAHYRWARPLNNPQASANRKILPRQHGEDERYPTLGTPVGPKLEPSRSVGRCGAEVFDDYNRGHEPEGFTARSGGQNHPLVGYPPLPRPQQHLSAPDQSRLRSPAQYNHRSVATYHPDIDDLATEVYHDVLKTCEDFSWSPSTSLVHEISRSWSRGTLHRHARALGPAGAGLDMLHSVSDRVSEWVGLSQDRELRDWLAEEREWLRRTENWTGERS